MKKPADEKLNTGDIGRKHMKNLFYSAADKIGQKPDSILYRLPTWHPIYPMPFGQSENVIFAREG
ncbi:MAG: hypothetical protein NTX75_07085 [Proteobacteria bacterium]|nr:hypothetical protein [Pseudomonadota bacterium]